MHIEIASAATHLGPLLTSSSPVSLETFKCKLIERLASQYISSWHPEDPDRGSAARALHWQPSAGGEGCSLALLHACQGQRLTFTTDFTMWIDPGCVAIRTGAGPGLSQSQSNNILASVSHSQEHVKVLYGALPAKYANSPSRVIKQSPLITLSSSKAAVLSRPKVVSMSKSTLHPVPSVTVSPSTPAMAEEEVQPDATPVVPWNDGGAFSLRGQRGLRSRSRRGSDGSGFSGQSGSPGSDGFSSLSIEPGTPLDAVSVGTSAPATSPPTSEPFNKLESSAWPVERASSLSKHLPSQTVDLTNIDLHGLGLEDCGLDEAEVTAETNTSLRARLEAGLGADDSRDGEGDDTIRSLNEGDDTVCAQDENIPDTGKSDAQVLAAVAMAASATVKPSHSRHSSTSSIASFDNGNVKVLGGGVKLGGSSCSGKTSRHRSQSSMSSASSLTGGGQREYGHRSTHSMSRTGGWAAQQQHLQQEANMHALPGAAQHGVEAYHLSRSTQMGSSAAGVHRNETLSDRRDAAPLSLSQRPKSITLSGTLETPKVGNFGDGRFPLPSPALSSSTNGSSSHATDEDEAESDDEDDVQDSALTASSSGKRSRTRGRRSRGRGAGRAARRAAAAAISAANALGLPSPPLPSPGLPMGTRQHQQYQQPCFQGPPKHFQQPQPLHMGGPFMSHHGQASQAPPSSYFAQPSLPLQHSLPQHPMQHSRMPYISPPLPVQQQQQQQLGSFPRNQATFQPQAPTMRAPGVMSGGVTAPQPDWQVRRNVEAW